MNGNGRIEFPPVADTLAGMEADPAADGGERIFLQDGFPGFLEKALCSEHLNPGDVLSGRAGGAAGGRLFVVTRPQESPGSCLVGLRGRVRTGHEKGRDVFRCFRPGHLLNPTLQGKFWMFLPSCMLPPPHAHWPSPRLGHLPGWPPRSLDRRHAEDAREGADHRAYW